jgi:uncharacterized protein (TIGR00369 family)
MTSPIVGRGLDPAVAAWIETVEPASIRGLVGLTWGELAPGRSVQTLDPTDHVVEDNGCVAIGAVAVLADSTLGTAAATGGGYRAAVTTSLRCDLAAPLPASASVVCIANAVAVDESGGIVTGTIEAGDGTQLGHVAARFVAGGRRPSASTRPPTLPSDDSGRGVAGSDVDRMLGVQAIEAGDGRCVLRSAARPALANGHGLVHGGTLSWLGHRAARHALDQTELTDLALEVDFFVPVPAGGPPVTVTAVVVKRTRRFAWADADVVTDDGRLAARVRTMFAVPSPPAL